MVGLVGHSSVIKVSGGLRCFWSRVGCAEPSRKYVFGFEVSEAVSLGIGPGDFGARGKIQCLEVGPSMLLRVLGCLFAA